MMRRAGLLAAAGGIAFLLVASYARAQQAPPAAEAGSAAQASPAPKEAAPAAPAAAVKKFTLVSVLIGETKFWLPSTIIVDEGDKVKLTLKNQVPGPENQHGFTIPDYNIVTLVTRGTPVVIHFTADKPGVFPYFCQLHPAHIGGQLVVHSRMIGIMMQHGMHHGMHPGMMHPEGTPESK
ncbi:MAG: cupredoxin domain-containing protein [Candidatus Binataceae bacterium]